MPEKIFIISELYYPEQNATGYFLTGIAEGLAKSGSKVGVITGQPTYNQRGTRAPKREMRNGVSIRRCWSTTLDHRSWFGRGLNFLTASLSLGCRSLREIRRGDKVLVVTNPPFLPFLVRAACFLKRAQFTLLVHDVYPDVFASVGMIKKPGWAYTLLDLPNKALYRSSQEIIVLGRDMAELAGAKLKDGGGLRIRQIPNWAADEIVSTEPPSAPNGFRRQWNLPEDAFVLLYNGNHGRTHFLEVWVEVAKALSDDREFQFVFAGEGSGKAKLLQKIEEAGVRNIRTRSFVPKEDLPSLLISADMLLLSFCPGMAGVSVPSRLYNLMAVGRPVMALADPGSEVARVLQEEECGWVVSPDRDLKRCAGDIADVLRTLKEDREKRIQRGANGRRAALEKYTREAVLDHWRAWS